MTRKSKKHKSDSDEELKAALDDPNAIVRYNYDGTYIIDYLETENQKIKPIVDHSDMQYDIYTDLIEYCRNKGLFLLDSSDFTSFVEFIECMSVSDK